MEREVERGVAIDQMDKKINIASKTHRRGILLVSNEMTSILSFGWKSEPNQTTLSATPCVYAGVSGCSKSDVGTAILVGGEWSMVICDCVCVCDEREGQCCKNETARCDG